MTAPLDEKALAEARTSFEMENSLERAIRAIRAYLAASPSPSEMDVARKLRERSGFMREAGHDDDAELDLEAADALDQAQSALAAMGDKLAIAERNRDAGRDNFHTMQQSAADLAAQVLRLTEELLRMQMALVGWVNVAEMLADEPGMEPHFHDIADATQNEVEAARTALKENAL